MITIPQAVLEQIAQHRPHLAAMINNLHAAQPEQVDQIERALASAYLAGETKLSAQETWYLAQVAHGGPWGGDWVNTTQAAIVTGYDESHLRRLAGTGEIRAIKRGKTWYLKRDSLPRK